MIRELRLRLQARIRRLTHPEPLVAPTPSDLIADPALTGAAVGPFFTKIATAEEYHRYVAERAQLLEDRVEYEANLIPRDDHFLLAGYCAPCQRETTFAVDFLYSLKTDVARLPNWRERLICRRCKLPNRLRGTVDFMESVLHLRHEDAVYVTEQTTPFFRFLMRRYPKTIGSEFLSDGTPLGKANALGVRNEDLTRLSMADESLDAICTTDVLEHVPDYSSALSECFRALRSGGSLVISVPFLLNSVETLVRARLDARGFVEHLLPPEYHGDPLNDQGVLCYYHFGWDLLKSLRRVGFDDAALFFYWSCRRGYLGGLQFLICATKNQPIASSTGRKMVEIP